MTKHLRFLFVMLLAMIWSAGWAAVGDNFKLVTDAKDLKAGDKIIIGSKASGKVLGADNGKKKRMAVSATFSNDGVVAWQEGFDVITLEGTASAWYLHSQAGYLYAKPGKGTTDLFKIDSKADANTSLISIDSDFDAHISFNGVTSSAREILCNAITDKTTNVTTFVFGHYATTVKTTTPSQIYKLVNSGETKTDTKVSFGENSGKTFTFTEGEYTDDTFTTPTATETNGVAGTVAYSSSNATAISVNSSTGELSFPGYGEATITATFTPTDTETYAGSTDCYTVKNLRGVVAGTITFDKANGAFEGLSSSDYDANGIGNFSFISDSKESFTFDCTRVLKSDGCIQLKKTSATEINKIVSPTFPNFANGYKVNIIYSSKKGLKLSAGGKDIVGSTTATNEDKGLGANVSISVPANASFVMTSGSEVVYISKIEIIPNKVDETTDITLDEKSESNTIEAKTGVNVTLKRTMVANEWNTICLPFDVTMDKAKAAFGDNVKIVELDTKAAVDANVLSFKASTVITAATPYLIKPSAVADEYTFENVDITNKAADYSTTANVDVAFKGIYNMVDITKDVVEFGATYYAAFLGADNKIYKAKANGNKTKGFRAYFAIPKSASASALRVVIDGTATSIKNIDSEVVESNAPVYNLQGQRVDGNNLTPGIYVKAGKKFVVK